MERRSRISAVDDVDDELQLAERTPEPMPEPCPNPPMLPPFRRPRRPAAPPPPPPSSPSVAMQTPPSPAPVGRSSMPEPPRRSLGDFLPRRSLLAPEVTRPSDDEYARGRDSEESKGSEPESDKPRDHPRRKRRSRILSDLRPVDGPQSALPSVPAISDTASQDGDNPLEAPDSGARAKEAFAAQRVRMRKANCPDLWIYMKNGHPFFGICAAHRHHPYKRGDRFLVLLVALLVALLLCGLFAIRDCCTEVLDVPVAVINRRLEIQAVDSNQQLVSPAFDAGSIRHLRGSRRMTETALAASEKVTTEDAQCISFYGDCSAVSAVCAEGSTCRVIKVDEAKNSSAVLQCVPNETPLQTCAVASKSCPTGWMCSQDSDLCVPASNYVCYLGYSESERDAKSVNFATDSDDGTFTAIEAIFQILQIAADKQAAKSHNQTLSSNSVASDADDDTDQQSQTSISSSTASSSATATPSTSSSSSDLSSSASTSSSTSTHSSESSSSQKSHSASSSGLPTASASHSASSSTSESASGSLSPESSSVKVTLTKPVNGGVYSLSSTILVEWHLTLLSGPNAELETFRVDFSADNGAFDTIATSVSASSSSASLSSQKDNDSIFQFEWDLADNTSWLCTTCVLRVCALDVESASDESLCIRSDGKVSTSEDSSRRLQTSTTVTSSGSGEDITFRIVREALECSCGMAHASFLLAAVIIGVCIPIVVLFAEPLVTFYRDRQLFGLFARRGGPVRPVIAGYSVKPATRKGRVVLVIVLLALCVACGFVAAQITTTKFLTEKGNVIVLWAVTFAIAAGLGVMVYSTVVCFVLFNVRWWRERSRERREPSGLSEFRNSLLSNSTNKSHGSETSPL